MMYSCSSRMPTGRRQPRYRRTTLKSGFKVFHEDLSSVTNLVGKLDTHRRRGYSWLRSQGKTKAFVRACACSRTRVRDVYWGVEEKIGSVTDTWCETTVSLVFSLSCGDSEAKKEPGSWETRKKRSRRRRERGRDRGRGKGEERVHLLNPPSASSGQLPRVRDAESYTLDTAAPHSGYMACHPEYYSSRLTAQSVNARYCLTRVVRREANQHSIPTY